jgi:c-di-GMP-binding flagellar brake protein YcgR
MSDNQPTITSVALAKAGSILSLATKVRARVKISWKSLGRPLYGNFHDSSSDRIILFSDELRNRPELCLFSVPQKAELTFATDDNGVYLAEAKIIGIQEQNEIVCLWPSQIFLIQRRRKLRIFPADEIPAVCTSAGQPPFASPVTVVNISSDGICLEMPATDSVNVGTILPDIELQLGDLPHLHLTGIVRALIHARGNTYQLGIEWSDLSDDQTQALETYTGTAPDQDRS